LAKEVQSVGKAENSPLTGFLQSSLTFALSWLTLAKMGKKYK